MHMYFYLKLSLRTLKSLTTKDSDLRMKRENGFEQADIALIPESTVHSVVTLVKIFNFDDFDDSLSNL